MRPLTHKLVRDVGRHRTQFAAVTLTIFLGVAMFAASYDSFQNLRVSYEQTFTTYRFANLTISGGDTGAIAHSAGATAGVGFVDRRTVLDLPIAIGEHKLLGRLVGMPAGLQPQVNQVELLRGELPTPDTPDGVLVEEHMADHFDLAEGDTLSVLGIQGWREVTVSGVISSPEYIWPARSRQEIMTTPDNFGVLFGSDELASGLAMSGPNEVVVFYTDGTANDQLTRQLSDMAIGLGALNTFTRAEQASNAALSEDLKGFEELAVFFPILFLAAAAMAAYVMISRLVHAQRPHIGVMLANGFTRGQVMRHYLSYGLAPGLAGAVPGAVAGVLLARLITGFYTEVISVPVTLIRFYPTTLVTAVAIGLLASVVAAAAPALVASRISPAEAMRGAVAAGRGRPSLAERMIPPLSRSPIRWRMALRGIERNPRRTIYTVVGVVLSLTLILVSWGMMDTTVHLMDLQFKQIQREDATVYFTGPAGLAQVSDLESVSGVSVAEPALQTPTVVSAGGKRYETALMALEARTVMRRFRGENGDWVTLPPDGILVGRSLREVLDIGVGDKVKLAFSDSGLSVEDRIAGFLDEPLGTMVYASRAHAEQLAGTALPASAALVRYDAGADADAVRAALIDRPGVAAFEDTKSLYGLISDYMVLFYAFVGVMLAFGAAMAFALIFNTMSVNIAERTREVATLLAMGTARRSISRLIAGENLLVIIGGIPIGLVVGYFVSKMAMASFESDLFSFDLYVKPLTFVWSSLALVAVALLSQWPGLRAVRRIHIPTVVKERST